MTFLILIMTSIFGCGIGFGISLRGWIERRREIIARQRRTIWQVGGPLMFLHLRQTYKK